VLKETQRVTAVGLLAALSLVSSAGAAFPGRNGLIAFSVTRGTDYEIMVVRPNGTGLKQLTRNAVDDGQPAWSPGGKLIAFVRARTSIWVARADGSRARKLAAGSSPAWSPDGRRLAFLRQVAANTGLAVMNADGSRVRTLLASGADGRPSWSPDGRRIAFIRNSDVWVIGPNGGGLRQLTATEVDEADPDWAPDASRIVFARHHPCGGSCDVPGLVTINPNGVDELEITDYDGLVQPSWSPNGRQIVATGARQGLSILSSSGQLLGVIAQKADPSEQGIFDPAWQPIGG
jgi:Tol biopolymer transport system component